MEHGSALKRPEERASRVGQRYKGEDSCSSSRAASQRRHGRGRQAEARHLRAPGPFAAVAAMWPHSLRCRRRIHRARQYQLQAAAAGIG